VPFPFDARDRLAAYVSALFQNLVHAAWIHVVISRDPVLKFSVPIPNPNVHGIREREAVAGWLLLHLLRSKGAAARLDNFAGNDKRRPCADWRPALLRLEMSRYVRKHVSARSFWVDANQTHISIPSVRDLSQAVVLTQLSVRNILPVSR
jgi:hypothetical protein